MKPRLLLAAANKDKTEEQKIISGFGRVLGEAIIFAFNQNYPENSTKEGYKIFYGHNKEGGISDE